MSPTAVVTVLALAALGALGLASAAVDPALKSVALAHESCLAKNCPVVGLLKMPLKDIGMCDRGMYCQCKDGAATVEQCPQEGSWWSPKQLKFDVKTESCTAEAIDCAETVVARICTFEFCSDADARAPKKAIEYRSVCEAGYFCQCDVSQGANSTAPTRCPSTGGFMGYWETQTKLDADKQECKADAVCKDFLSR